ncbi:MAG: type IV toxin-antitoxin system AbiEi family antitoxin [Marivita sp.]|uniref:type IV toxin-antitoxin system AbiEi family antitoxin domain-containing protein n=1 Tax=Marivita sp. TaxID=2003365 RepID=UPI0025B945DA|nr:type IV toxin-antitoxin system AbiEi family antitoxin [Marivita sp.]MCI5111270.1 type IV toxin-antitoxin system AbiEi family antitoxin [Marivita sp.]
MNNERRTTLAEYVKELQSKGRIVFDAEEAVEALDTNRGAFLDAAQRLQKRGLLISPRKGFYVVVPPQFASWGAPPPSWYIDPLMRQEQQPYYVGLLKAAELHGATHQAVMEFQVLTSKRMPRIRAGRNLIVFYYRKEMASIADAIEEVKTDTGRMKVSSPALTALDLVRYGKASAGIDNVATVLADLGPKIDSDQLAFLSLRFEKPVVQRLGYMLDILDRRSTARKMHEMLMSRGNPPWTELDRAEARDPLFAPDPVERDQRWRVVVRRHPEVDE